jgi:DNA-directed RNA polymerase specialized sigma24 family protein
MSALKRVGHQDRSDQQLVDQYRKLKDREALVELYERYRVSLGRYLNRDIKSKITVVDTFNTIMLSLVTNPSHQLDGRKVATKLFAMAYKLRLEHLSKKNNQNNALHAAPTKPQEESTFESKLASLPRLHADVLELVYRNNFTFDEAAEIIGCTTSVIRNCLSHIKKQHRSLFEAKTSAEDRLNYTEARGQSQIDNASINNITVF